MIKDKIIIVGAGPAGLGAAYALSQEKSLEVLVIDKGKDSNLRSCCQHKKKIMCNPCDSSW